MTYVETLIDRASYRAGSRYKLAQQIGESASFLGRIARGEKRLSPAAAAKAAVIAGDDPRDAALLALLAQAKDDAERDELARLWGLDWRKR
jgi:hypothetical protein